MPNDKPQTTDAEFIAAWRKTFGEIESAGGHVSHNALAIKRLLHILDKRQAENEDLRQKLIEERGYV